MVESTLEGTPSGRTEGMISAPLRPGDLAHHPEQEVSWVWNGYVARRSITLLTSQWKSGKTTLVALLLARLDKGGPLAGLEVRPGHAAVVSEEPEPLWARRHRALGFGDELRFFCQPFAGKPTDAQWQALADELDRMGRAQSLDLVVIDSLAAFLPAGAESNPDLMVRALAPMRRLAWRGPAVLLLHHPSKGHAAAGQAARGTGALGGLADVVMEMKWYTRGNDLDRRRRLEAWSRLEGTPRQLVLELSADGTQYQSLGDYEQVACEESWRTIEGLLKDPPRRLTRRQMLKEWPQVGEIPSPASLRRWIEDHVAKGRLEREGSGHRYAPYRYGLPGVRPDWRFDPLASLGLGEA